MYTDFGVSIPAVRVRYITEVLHKSEFLKCFNSRSAGKIHSVKRVNLYNDSRTFQFPQCG